MNESDKRIRAIKHADDDYEIAWRGVCGIFVNEKEIAQLANDILNLIESKKDEVDTANTDFSLRIKQVRQQLRLTQEALAQELGVSLATISRWESGKTKPIKLLMLQFESFCARRLK